MLWVDYLAFEVTTFPVVYAVPWPESPRRRRCAVSSSFFSRCGSLDSPNSSDQHYKGEWERMEGFISRRSEAEFSHGICPSCSDTHYPGLA